MKLTKNLFCATVATALAFASINASATIQSSFPIVKLNISGTISYSDGSVTTNGNTIKGTPLKKVSITTKSLIGLLNASPSVTNTLTDLGLPNQIPAGSYFIWNLANNDSLSLTNKNGFMFTLDGVDPVLTNSYDYGDVYVDQQELIGTFTVNAKTGAGNESDLTGDEIFFDDGNGNNFDSYGNGTLKWNYGKATSTNGVQQTTLNASLPAPEGYHGEIDYNDAMTLANFKASGSGKGTDPVYQIPFYLWY